MLIRWSLASLHLIALAVGASAIWARTVALRTVNLDRAALERVFRADLFWGIAAALWLATGVPRAFLGVEKGSSYYLHNRLFLAKMALFLVVFVMEIRPMTTLARWRRAARAGATVDTSAAPALARTSMIQSHILVAMILLAAAMARGIG
jgi:putative membrane protein